MGKKLEKELVALEIPARTKLSFGVGSLEANMVCISMAGILI